MGENELIYKTKPTYNIFIRLFSKNFLFSLGLLVIIGWFTMFGFVIVDPHISMEKCLEIYIQINICVFVLSILLLLIIDKMNYMATTYELCSNKINFYEGFFNHKGVEINLKNINEIHFTQNYLQKFFGLGTIKFLTAAYDGQNNDNIAFTDIQNGYEIYEKIKDILLIEENGVNNEIVIETKPKYNETVCLFTSAIVKSFGSIMWLFLGLCWFALFLLPTMTFDNGKCFEQVFGIILHNSFSIVALVFLTTLIVINYLTKKNYEVTNYKVYSNQLELNEGFINHKHILIKIENIKEIHLTQNYFQRMADLGTIRFITAANDSKSIPGTSFNDIVNPLAIYTKLKQIHVNKND